MSAKLYREIIKFIEFQSDVIRSFERSKPNLLNNDVKEFIGALRENLDRFKVKTNKIVGDDENGN